MINSSCICKYSLSEFKHRITQHTNKEANVNTTSTMQLSRNERSPLGLAVRVETLTLRALTTMNKLTANPTQASRAAVAFAAARPVISLDRPIYRNESIQSERGFCQRHFDCTHSIRGFRPMSLRIT